jgi:hypothetical protein
MRGNHIMERVPYGESFPLHTGELLRNLFSRLQLIPSEIELTTEGVEVVARALEVLFPEHDEDYIYPPDEPDRQLPLLTFFPELCAFLGEVMIRKFSGRWEMRRVQYHPPAFEPFVIGQDDHDYHFAYDLVESMIKESYVNPLTIFLLSIKGLTKSGEAVQEEEEPRELDIRFILIVGTDRDKGSDQISPPQ